MSPQLEGLMQNIEEDLIRSEKEQKTIQSMVHQQKEVLEKKKVLYKQHMEAPKLSKKSEEQEKREKAEHSKKIRQLEEAMHRLKTTTVRINQDIHQKENVLSELRENIKKTVEETESFKNVTTANHLKDLAAQRQTLEKELKNMKEVTKQKKSIMTQAYQAHMKIEKRKQAENHKVNQTSDIEQWLTHEEKCRVQYTLHLESITSLSNALPSTSLKVAPIDTAHGYTSQAGSYLDSIKEDLEKITLSVIPACEKKGAHLLEQLNTKLRLLLPNGAMAITAGRMIKILLQAQQAGYTEKSTADSFLELFPPQDENRHMFKKVATILMSAGIIEILPSEKSCPGDTLPYYCCLPLV
ncbi:hypothetical protein BDF14DRAFT_1826658 [Spinellus fusiger]|nr:hypothetical protein BDF14DRAFT_1826658 [Spinellus fusiger]